MTDLMKEFATKNRRPQLLLEFREDARHRVRCDDPVVVARFVSEVRQQLSRQEQGARLFLRGQVQDFGGMVPALFRETTETEKTLREAETWLEKLVPKALPKNARFQRPELAALLQHYGVKTSWLDVVDDLRVAVWFATHTIARGQVQRRTDGSGWLFLLATKSDVGRLTPLDLRIEHQGLSLRPHVQQGWSLPCGSGRDLNEYVAATVEFPIGTRWYLDGYLATAAYLFPPETRDDTLKRLLRPEVKEALRRAEQQEGLQPGRLGAISVVVDG